LDDFTSRPLLQITAALQFSDFSDGGRVFDKFTRAISSRNPHLFFSSHKHSSSAKKKSKIFVIVPLQTTTTTLVMFPVEKETP